MVKQKEVQSNMITITISTAKKWHEVEPPVPGRETITAPVFDCTPFWQDRFEWPLLAALSYDNCPSGRLSLTVLQNTKPAGFPICW